MDFAATSRDLRRFACTTSTSATAHTHGKQAPGAFRTSRSISSSRHDSVSSSNTWNESGYSASDPRAGTALVHAYEYGAGGSREAAGSSTAAHTAYSRSDCSQSPHGSRCCTTRTHHSAGPPTRQSPFSALPTAHADPPRYRQAYAYEPTQCCCCSCHSTDPARPAGPSSAFNSRHVQNTQSREKAAYLAAGAYVQSPPAHSTPLVPQQDPVVQRTSKLNEEAWRVHCYISEDASDDLAGADLLPPIMPPIAEHAIPFWRPPAVLESTPHYAPRAAVSIQNLAGSPPRQSDESDEERLPPIGAQMAISTLVAEPDRPSLPGFSSLAVPKRAARKRSVMGGEGPRPKAARRDVTALPANNFVVITCYHAAVAQKSYGGEKRFLCPPPAVLMCGEGLSAQLAHHSPMVLSVVTDAGGKPGGRRVESGDNARWQAAQAGSARPSSSAHAPLECQTSFNERNVALFKSLHVTGMQKAKSFHLRLELMTAASQGWRPRAFASLESDAVAIISKPSKKTAKARNQSSCIRAGALISLFNRINSQTFRTKYLNVDHRSNRWVAQSHNWSPFEVECTTARHGALYYGSEIVLVETHRNFRSPPMLIHKVERGRLVPDATSPVSQMQKVALQLKPEHPDDPPRYLKADVGHYSSIAGAPFPSHSRFDDPDGSPELTFETVDGSRLTRSRSRPAAGAGVDLDDFFCWTIVGISGFTYSYSVPQDPLPRDINPIPHVVSAPYIDSADGTLEVLIRNFSTDDMVFLVAGLTADIIKVAPRPAAPKSKAAQQKAHDGAELFTMRLPAGANGDVEGGPLCVRRSDGILFDTKWKVAVSETPTGRFLSVEYCKLDI